MRVRLALVLVLAIVSTAAFAFATHPAVAQGGRSDRPAAPGFSVNRLPDGRSLSLSDLRGRVVLVYFFFPT